MTTQELNIKFDAFKTKWLGNRDDFDGAPKGEVFQCVDVPKRFWNTYWGTPNVPVGSAIRYMTINPFPAKLSGFLDRIKTKDVKKCDAVVLYTNGHIGNPNIGDGHIGLATGNVSGDTVEILEQNGSTGKGQGTGGDAIRLRYIPKNRIAGVLRPKVQNPTPAPKLPDTSAVKSFRVKPGFTFRVYKPGTTTVLGTIDHSWGWYQKRGYDAKYPNRWLGQSATYGQFAFPYADVAGNSYLHEIEVIK